MPLPEFFRQTLREPRFEDAHGELKAVYQGEKAMSVFIVAGDNKISQQEKSLRTICKKLGLVIVDHSPWYREDTDAPHGERYIFVMKELQSWRVKTYVVVRKIAERFGWSDGLEALDSHLLGYSEDDIKSWLEHKAEQSVSWRGIKVYTLISANQFEKLKELGKKAFDPKLYVDGLEIFYMRKDVMIDNSTLKELKSGLHIARFTLDRSTFSNIFGHPSGWEAGWFVKSTVESSALSLLNSGLRNNIEVYKDSSWI